MGKEKQRVVQSNVITSARYDFTGCQLDILFMLLSKVHKDDPEDALYTLHISELEETTGNTWNYQQFRESTAIMGSRMYEIGKKEDKKNTYTQLWIFDYVTHQPGSITVKLTTAARPFFVDLKNKFTMMQLISILGCDSKYAKRMYALACQWKSKGGHEFELEELKYMLHYDKEKNDRISDFRKFVLEIAQKQINEKTDLNVELLLTKKYGRSFTHVNMIVTAKELVQPELDFTLPPSIPAEEIKMKDLLMKYSFDEPVAKKVAAKLQASNKAISDLESYIQDANRSFKKAAQNGEKIENIHGYLIAILKNKKLY